jgi:cysteine desulfurase
VAGLLGARPEEIIFTSGGTESNNLAIQGLIWELQETYFFPGPRFSLSASRRTSARPFEKVSFLPHFITTNIEHPSVLETCRMLEKRGLVELTIVPVEANGIVDPEKIKKAIKQNTVLISIIYANNEIGTIQPIREIAKEIRRYQKYGGKTFVNTKVLPPYLPFSPLFHTDAAQAANYLDLKVEKLGVNLLSLSGGKIAGSGRIGVLYRKKGTPLINVFGGGSQEFGLRPGTENLSEILKFSRALKLAQRNREKETKRLLKLRNYFIDQLLHSKILKNYRIVLNGDLEKRLPNNVNISIPKIPSDLLVLELSARGVYVSEKSACQSREGESSYVIQALNKQGRSLPKENISSLRFSFGPDTTKANLNYTLQSLSKILQKLEKWYN